MWQISWENAYIHEPAHADTSGTITLQCQDQSHRQSCSIIFLSVQQLLLQLSFFPTLYLSQLSLAFLTVLMGQNVY